MFFLPDLIAHYCRMTTDTESEFCYEWLHSRSVEDVAKNPRMPHIPQVLLETDRTGSRPGAPVVHLFTAENCQQKIC